MFGFGSEVPYPVLDSLHCLLCHRPQGLVPLGEVAGRNPGLAKDFQQILNYLTGVEGDHDHDPGPRPTWEGRCQEEGTEDRRPAVLCSTCYDIMAGLHKLHLELLRIQWLIQKQVEGAREKVDKLRRGGGGKSSPAPWMGRGRQQVYSGTESSRSGEVSHSQVEISSRIESVDNTHHNNFVSGPGEDLPSCYNHPRTDPGPGSPQSYSDSKPHTGELGLSKPIKPETDEDEAIVKDEEVDNVESEEEDLFRQLENLAPDMEDTGTHNQSRLQSSLLDQDEDEAGEEEEYIPSPEEGQEQSYSSSSYPSSPEGPPSPPVMKRKRNQTTDNSGPRQAKKSKAGKGASGSTGDKLSEEDNSDIRSNSNEPGKKKRVETRIRKRPQLILPLIVQGNTTFQNCDLCKELLPSSEIATHLETQHGLQGFIKNCPNHSCPYVFSCRGKLERHLCAGNWSANKCRIKAGLPLVAPFKKCQLCRFQTKYMIKFGRHLETHESGKDDMEKSLRCPIAGCPKSFAFRQSLEEHLFTHDYEDQLRASRRRVVDGVAVSLLQNCDLCWTRMPISQIAAHLEEIHHVGDYITKCPNPTCGKAFSCRLKMDKHLGQPMYKTNPCRIAANLPEKRPSIKCDTCNLEVPRLRFQNHLQRHECQFREKILPCPIPGCEERYALRQSMEEHLFIHDFRPPRRSEQECSVCKQLVKIEEIPNHLREAHEVADVIPCKRCPLQFHDWESLLDHLEEHRSRRGGSRAGGGGFSCDLCKDALPVKFLLYDNLRGHFFNVHQIGKKFICENCEMDFFSRQALSLHRRSKHSEGAVAAANNPSISKTSAKVTKTKQPFKCDLCPDVSFVHRDSLRNHNMAEHGAPPALCKFCSKPFTSFSRLRGHERTHMGLTVRTYQCRFENCNRVFKDKSRLTYHERGDHRDALAPKLFICDTCGKGFNTPNHLKAHARQVHSGKKGPRPVCDVCGESFANKCTLQRHTLIHSGARPHKCEICGQDFRHTNALATHLKAHQEKGNSFKPNGPMKNIRKRVGKN